MRNLAAGFRIPKLLDFALDLSDRSEIATVDDRELLRKLENVHIILRVQRVEVHACANLFSVKAGCTQTDEAYRSHFGRRTYRRSYVYA